MQTMDIDPYDEQDFEDMWLEYQRNIELENAYLDMEPIDLSDDPNCPF